MKDPRGKPGRPGQERKANSRHARDLARQGPARAKATHSGWGIRVPKDVL